MKRTVHGCTEGTAVFETLDAVQAVDFLERRACALRHALASPDDASAVDLLRMRQANSHDGWLSLISTLERSNDCELSEHLANLYGFHGRVAACLERGLDPRLDEQVAARVRLQLLTELQERTALVVSGLLRRKSAGAGSG